MNTPQPHFDSQAFLNQHVQDTLKFYEPTAWDAQGGFFHYFKDNGHVYERSHRHLVSATRFVFNWAQAFHHTRNPRYLGWTQHALAHLQRFVLPSGPQRGLSAWTLQDHQLEDRTVFAYGQAFVLLAQAHAHRVGCATAQDVADA
jgi:mannose/cellobiose epimerase-like protein (N-acyl-D-glucosamine 2-epimerase family)